MKLKDILTVCGVALVTMAVTVAALWPAHVTADNPPPAGPAAIEQPVLSANGCTLTIKSTAASHKAGDEPALGLTAINPTDKPVSLTVTVRMSATAPSSPLSRVMPTPTELWRGEVPLSLTPGQTLTTPVQSSVKLAGGSLVSVALSVGTNAITGTTFMVQGDRTGRQGPRQSN